MRRVLSRPTGCHNESSRIVPASRASAPMAEERERNPSSAGGSSLAHALELDALAAQLGSELVRGLSVSQAADLRQRHGANQLAQAPPTPAWQRFLSQFKEIVIWILIFAAIVAGAMGEVTDTVAILA